MALILCIDTATELGAVGLLQQDELLLQEVNDQPRDHASFVHLAIERIMAATGHHLQQLDAIAVSNGPGSYTGLRVGLSAAKGLCFALNRPLILLSTLQVMAAAVVRQTAIHDRRTAIVPMIDARRMEVFTAAYDVSLQCLEAPHAAILDASSLAGLLAERPVLCSGNGAAKLKGVVVNNNLNIVDLAHNILDMSALALQAYTAQSFAALAYAEPFYTKGFHNTGSKN